MQKHSVFKLQALWPAAVKRSIRQPAAGKHRIAQRAAAKADKITGAP